MNRPAGSRLPAGLLESRLSLQCEKCGTEPASCVCRDCELCYCKPCLDKRHAKGSFVNHNDVLQLFICDDCEQAVGRIFCKECDMSLCRKYVPNDSLVSPDPSSS